VKGVLIEMIEKEVNILSAVPYRRDNEKGTRLICEFPKDMLNDEMVGKQIKTILIPEVKQPGLYSEIKELIEIVKNVKGKITYGYNFYTENLEIIKVTDLQEE
jgi:hypothetical protein